MPNIFHHFYEKTTNELRNLKTDKEEDQVIINNLFKMIHCSRYDVYNNNIDMDFLNKVEVIKQYRQSVMNSGNVDLFETVIEKFLKFKVLTMAVVYGSDTKLLGDMSLAQLHELNLLE